MSHTVDPIFLQRKLKLSGKHQTFQLSLHAAYFTVFLVRTLTGNAFHTSLNQRCVNVRVSSSSQCTSLMQYIHIAIQSFFKLLFV